MIAAVRCVVYRDLLLALRRPSDVGTALLFFVIVASLFPLGVGAEPNQLRAIAPGHVIQKYQDVWWSQGESNP